MLTALSIRDVVLIERLDLSFGAGLTVLTGETGAGKSILLDSLGLALGVRADAGLVRTGAEQASVTACFLPPEGHPVATLLAEQGIEAEDALVLRRVLGRDGRSRAYVNDQPVGVTLLRRAGALLVEVQGQHEQLGLADPSSHSALLDAYGVPAALRAATADAWRAWRDALSALDGARAAIAAAERDEEWLRYALAELAALAPRASEEEELAVERRRLQRSERQTEALAAALSELNPRDRRGPAPVAAVRAAFRVLQRLIPAPDPDAAHPAAGVLAALERADEALAEAETLLSRLISEAEADPARLERAEERLFTLRAAARKHQIAVAELPALHDTLRVRLMALETGADQIKSLEQAADRARQAFVEAAAALSAARQAAAQRLERAVAKELPPLRLEKARFRVEIAALAEPEWGSGGTDAVSFLIAPNPGQELVQLGRVASGGELSRLMLALKVVLAAGSPVPTLVFDEVDSDIGGATAAAVGDRLARVAARLQVLVVTHSPQVAARGTAHLLVAKAAARGRASTLVGRLDAPARREEIARMLAGETITEAARAAADDLLGTAA